MGNINSFCCAANERSAATEYANAPEPLFKKTHIEN